MANNGLTLRIQTPRSMHNAEMIELDCGGKGASVRKLGGDRAGEMRISRFLHNRRVTAREIVETAAARTCAQVSGRHVLAIQDTTSVRVDERGFGLSAHPLIAVDAVSGFTFGLVDLILPRSPRARARAAQRAGLCGQGEPALARRGSKRRSASRGRGGLRDRGRGPRRRHL